MAKPIVAIVGRPNVGKSTLFNRIVGKRLAIVEDTPGITRDRLYADGDWAGREFTVVDTGGILLEEHDPLIKHVRAQADLAMEEADVILLVVDAREGITAIDQDVAEELRRTRKPVLLVVNKADNPTLEQEALDFYALGFSEVYPVAALSGRGVGDLLDEVVRLTPEKTEESPYPEDALRISIIGRPNVGKSSLTNAILGEERVIVSDIPGTTRDAIDTLFKRADRDFVLIDTAGIRRRGKIQGSVEYYCVLRAQRAIERSDVALLVMSGPDGVADGDKRVGGVADEAGRACVIVVNKWDLVENPRPETMAGRARRPSKAMREFTDLIRREMPFLSYAPVVFTSAVTGLGVQAALDTAVDAAENHSLRISTGELNRVIQEAIEARPYSERGRQLKVRYATMASVKPPTIILFVNTTDLFHFSYQRYLENRLREAFGFIGTPIRLFARKAKKEEYS